jgi:hypothetical protein
MHGRFAEFSGVASKSEQTLSRSLQNSLHSLRNETQPTTGVIMTI